jgi:hypothetical protein
MTTKQRKQDADTSTDDTAGEDFTADQEAAKAAPAPGSPTEDPAYDPDRAEADQEKAEQVASAGVKHTDPAPKATRLDEHNDAPSTVVPGDAPYDTTDPTERATTVGGDKRAAALAGHGTVNAAIPLPRHEGDTAGGAEAEHRIERYPATRPDGTVVTVTHNLDTGESKVSEGAE